jgi:hypothetical protein
MRLRRLVLESIRAGTIAALAMIPFGLAFRALGLRIGHYGPKFAALFVTDPGPAYLFLQHILIGWVSALPLVALLGRRSLRSAPIAIGAAYGALYYLVVNALALPLYFGDPLPWQLGVMTVLPSLVIHVVFGIACAWVASRWAPYDQFLSSSA